MKCVEKCDASAKGAGRKFLDMPIDHRNLLRNINFLKFPWLFLNFPDFQQNSKFPWQILKFPDFSLTLNFPDFSLTSGNPEEGSLELKMLVHRWVSYLVRVFKKLALKWYDSVLYKSMNWYLYVKKKNHN